MKTAMLALSMLAAGPAAADGPALRDAWLRVGPPGAPAVGYFTLHNGGPRTIEVVGVAAADFAAAELHETADVDGRARMRPVARRALAPGATLVAAPGGLHAMLFRPQRPLAPGARTVLTVLLADGARLTTEAVVRDARDGNPDPND